MTKTEFIRALNQRIDKLIINGLNTQKEKKEFKQLTKWHRQYVLSHLSKCLKG